ncbi:MAG TPA: AtpZ/AtpI family protein [Stellaceae bacterium]|nr:AtpZ/AtpI family protein [Stellaceae bacterium]
MVRAVPAAAAGTRSVLRSPKMSEGGPPDPLARLGERLDKARSRRGSEPVPGPDNAAMQQGVGIGLRIGIEFVVAVVVATGLGWVLDRWLGTRPWGTIVLFFLGVGAGMLSVYRAVTGIKMAVGSRPLGKPGAKGQPAKDAWDDDEA